MEINILNNYFNDENTYIISNNNEAAVIDPGIETEKIIKAANEKNAVIKYIFLTHCHYDHIAYLEELRKKTKAFVIASKNASENIKNPEINHSLSGLGYKLSARSAEIIMEDNEEREFIGLKFKCLYTPGHTNGGACFLCGDSVFVGDTLFLRIIGRSDLPTGDYETLINSIKTKLYTLSDETKVFSGHGQSTSIGYEKKFNFFVRG